MVVGLTTAWGKPGLGYRARPAKAWRGRCEGFPVGVGMQVDMSLYHNLGGHEKLVASCTGIFKKLGALRAL